MHMTHAHAHAHAHAQVFAPGELAASGYMYIVHRGMALYFGRVVTPGKVWGEDMILNAARLRYNISARAMNYLEVYMIGRSELFEVANSFPKSLKHIRMCAAKLALSRDVIFRAREETQRKAGLTANNAVGERLVKSETATFDRLFAMASSTQTNDLQGRLQQQAADSQALAAGCGGGRRGCGLPLGAGGGRFSRSDRGNFTSVAGRQLEEVAAKVARQSTDMSVQSRELHEIRDQMYLLMSRLQSVIPAAMAGGAMGTLQDITPPAASERSSGAISEQFSDSLGA